MKFSILLASLIGMATASVMAGGIVNGTLSASGGGGSGGSATNAIALLNGSGTNTTLVNVSIVSGGGNGSGLTNVIPADFMGQTNVVYMDLYAPFTNVYYGNALHPANSFISSLNYANTNPIYPNAAFNSVGFVLPTIRTTPGQTYIACVNSGQPIFTLTNSLEIDNYSSVLIGQTNLGGSGAFFTLGIRRTAAQGGTNAGAITINGGIVEDADQVDAHVFQLSNAGIFTNYVTLNDVRINNYNLGLQETANTPQLYDQLNFNNTVWHCGGDCFYLYSNPALTNEFSHCYFSATEEFTNTGYISQNNLPIGFYVGPGYYNFTDCQFKQTLFSGADMTISNATVNLTDCTFLSNCATNIYCQGSAIVNIYGYINPNTVFQDGTCTINFYNASNVLVLANLNVNSNLIVAGNSSLLGTNNANVVVGTNVQILAGSSQSAVGAPFVLTNPATGQGQWQPSNIQWTWLGPTNQLVLTNQYNYYLYIQMTNCTITNLVNLNSWNPAFCQLTISNASAYQLTNSFTGIYRAIPAFLMTSNPMIVPAGAEGIWTFEIQGNNTQTNVFNVAQ